MPLNVMAKQCEDLARGTDQRAFDRWLSRLRTTASSPPPSPPASPAGDDSDAEAQADGRPPEGQGGLSPKPYIDEDLFCKAMREFKKSAKHGDNWMHELNANVGEVFIVTGSRDKTARVRGMMQDGR